jgi:CheY-like chemotaxis protein
VRDEGVEQASRYETGSVSRRVLVVDADETSRQATEELLRREDFWTVTTGDPAAAEKLARAEAADIMAVDLDLGVLEAVPRWQRRQGDSAVRDTLPYWSGGYAVLRALHADSSCARFPLFRLKARSDDEGHEPPSRFGLLDCLPKASRPRELVDGLESVFRDVVEPPLLRDEQRQQADLQSGTQPGSGFRGNVELVGAAGLLQVCHVNRLSGTLTVRRGAQLVQLSFRKGEIVGASGLHVVRATDDAPEREDIVYALLGWPRGQFEFVPGPSVKGAPVGESFDWLVLEGCRRLDEQQAGRASGT